jgi:hypothetical protein
MRYKWIQHPITLKLVPADEYIPPSNNAPMIITDSLDEFVANGTATPTPISSKSQLRKYCKENGLVLNEDLKGLPVETTVKQYNKSKAEREIGEILKRKLFG